MPTASVPCCRVGRVFEAHHPETRALVGLEDSTHPPFEDSTHPPFEGSGSRVKRPGPDARQSLDFQEIARTSRRSKVCLTELKAGRQAGTTCNSCPFCVRE